MTWRCTRSALASTFQRSWSRPRRKSTSPLGDCWAREKSGYKRAIQMRASGGWSPRRSTALAVRAGNESAGRRGPSASILRKGAVGDAQVVGTAERAHRKIGKIRKIARMGAKGAASNATRSGREPASREASEAAKRRIVVHRLPSGRAHPINSADASKSLARPSSRWNRGPSGRLCYGRRPW
jgi:hypothetical protein